MPMGYATQTDNPMGSHEDFECGHWGSSSHLYVKGPSKEAGQWETWKY